VTNRRQETIQLETDLPRVVLALLDGSRDRDALLAELHRLLAAGDLEVRAAEGAGPASHLSDALDEALQLLARSALLVG
jgi:hypothetical protein